MKKIHKPATHPTPSINPRSGWWTYRALCGEWVPIRAKKNQTEDELYEKAKLEWREALPSRKCLRCQRKEKASGWR